MMTLMILALAVAVGTATGVGTANWAARGVTWP